MTISAHTVTDPDSELVERLDELLDDDVSISYGRDIPKGFTPTVLICGVPSLEMLEQCENLRSLIIPWAGLPGKTRELMLDFPEISVHNIHHNAIPTAESTLALLLTVARKIVPAHLALAQNDWTMRYDKKAQVTALYEKHAVILGFGHIGQHVAKLCRGLGMKVTGVKRTTDVNSNHNGIRPVSELDQILPEADALIVTVPFTAETKGLLHTGRLNLLKDNAILINVARAGIVDEEALYNELSSGRIRAGLDVWYQYPEDEAGRTHTPPSRFPFGSLDNVVITPHMSGHSDLTESLRARELATLLNLAAQGAKMPNRVDLGRGY